MSYFRRKTYFFASFINVLIVIVMVLRSICAGEKHTYLNDNVHLTYVKNPQ